MASILSQDALSHGSLSPSSQNSYLLFNAVYSGFFVPIHNEHMRKILGTRGYNKEFKQNLIDKSLILWDQSYSNFDSNRYTMQYAFNPPDAIYEQPQPFELTNKRFINKLNNMNIKRRSDLSPLLQKLEDVFFKVDFDADGAFKHILTQSYSSPQLANRLKSIQVMKDRSPLHIKLKESEKVGRIFTPITQMPKDIRPFLTHQGKGIWIAVNFPFY